MSLSFMILICLTLFDLIFIFREDLLERDESNQCAFSKMKTIVHDAHQERMNRNIRMSLVCRACWISRC